MAEGDGGQVAWLDALVEAVRLIHSSILETSGGVQGEHTPSLFGACARPFQTFDGIELYSSPYLRVAALFHGIIRDHPFADGNKRTATVASIGALAAEQLISGVSPLQVRLLGEIALWTADSSSGSMTVEEIASWLHRIFDAGFPEP